MLAIHPGVDGVFGPDWWRFYCFLQVYDTGTADEGLGIAWSLCIEFSFYLVLPLYAWATRSASRSMSKERRVRFQLTILTAMAICSIVLRVVAQSTIVQITLPTFLYWFALGMALAVLSVALRDRPVQPRAVTLVTERPGLAWASALVIYLGMCVILTSAPQHIFYSVFQAFWLYVLSGLVAFLVVVPAVFGDGAGGRVRQVLRWRWLAWLGLISYGLYLWHATIAFELVAEGVQDWWTLLPAHTGAGDRLRDGELLHPGAADPTLQVSAGPPPRRRPGACDDPERGSLTTAGEHQDPPAGPPARGRSRRWRRSSIEDRPGGGVTICRHAPCRPSRRGHGLARGPRRARLPRRGLLRRSAAGRHARRLVPRARRRGLLHAAAARATGPGASRSPAWG